MKTKAAKTSFYLVAPKKPQNPREYGQADGHTGYSQCCVTPYKDSQGLCSRDITR